jgi:hypothetical protein
MTGSAHALDLRGLRLLAAAAIATAALAGCGDSGDAGATPASSTASAGAENSAGVSPDEFGAIAVGDTEADARHLLGKPTGEEKTTVEDAGEGVCAFWGEVGEPTYEVCFVDGKVALKNEL